MLRIASIVSAGLPHATTIIRRAIVTAIIVRICGIPISDITLRIAFVRKTRNENNENKQPRHLPYSICSYRRLINGCPIMRARLNASCPTTTCPDLIG